LLRTREDSIGQYGIFLERHGSLVLFGATGEILRRRGQHIIHRHCFHLPVLFFSCEQTPQRGVDRQVGIGGAISISGIMINAMASGNAMKYFFLGIKCSFYFLLILCIWAGVLSVVAFAFAFLLHLANGLGKRYFIFRFITAPWLVVFLQLGAF
jgi:hypothetical protein